MSRSRRARSAVLCAVLAAAGYSAPAALPLIAASAHTAFHLLEQPHEEHARMVERVLHSQGADPDGHARPHSHGDGSAPHTHAAPVDALLALAEGDAEPAIGPAPEPPPRVAGYLPASEPFLPVTTASVPRIVDGRRHAPSDWTPRPSVPPPRPIEAARFSRS